MTLALIIAFVATVATLIVIAVFALSRHKKAGSGDLKLVGEIAHVDKRLEPEGTVLVGGELWRARSHDGSAISKHAQVRIIGFQDHLVLVEPAADKN